MLTNITTKIMIRGDDMTKNEMKELCLGCGQNNNGWCKEISTNNIDVKMEKCPIISNDTETCSMEIILGQLSDLKKRVAILEAEKK